MLDLMKTLGLLSAAAVRRLCEPQSLSDPGQVGYSLRHSEFKQALGEESQFRPDTIMSITQDSL